MPRSHDIFRLVLCAVLILVLESATIDEIYSGREKGGLYKVNFYEDEPRTALSPPRYKTPAQYKASPDFRRGPDINTSVAFALPLFSFTMPGYREEPTLTDYVSQAAIAIGGFSLITFAGAYFPFLLGVNGPSTIGRSDEGFASVFRDCGQLAVCEAHSRPGDFGLLALPIIYFFPGDEYETSDLSPWTKAANIGRSRRECYDEYQCLISPLWAVNYILTTFF